MIKLDATEILELGQEQYVNNDPKQKTEEEVQEDSRKKQERHAKVSSAAARLYRTEDGLETDDIDKTKPIVPQLEKFSNENQLDLKSNIGWKVELSKRVKRKFDNNVSDDIEEMWRTLFKAIKS